jgi:hypothetical protein
MAAQTETVRDCVHRQQGTIIKKVYEVESGARTDRDRPELSWALALCGKPSQQWHKTISNHLLLPSSNTTPRQWVKLSLGSHWAPCRSSWPRVLMLRRYWLPV